MKYARNKKYDGKVISRKTIFSPGERGETGYYNVTVELEYPKGTLINREFVFKGGDGSFPILTKDIVFKVKEYLHKGRTIYRMVNVQRKENYHIKPAQYNQKQADFEYMHNI